MTNMPPPRHPHRKVWVAISIGGYVGLLPTMGAILFLARLPEAAKLMETLSPYLWMPLLVWLATEVFESATRRPEKLSEWVLDNLTAGATLFLGLMFLAIWWRSWDPWIAQVSSDGAWMEFQCTAFVAVDLASGIVIPYIFNGAWKQREETKVRD